jgi:hypothetical protein
MLFSTLSFASLRKRLHTIPTPSLDFSMRLVMLVALLGGGRSTRKKEM